MADHKQDETFKVVDRRLFNEEGELRKDALEQERREEEAAAKKSAPRSAPAAEPKSQTVENTPASGDAQGAAGDQSAPAEAPPEAGSRGFQMLVDLLTRNAAAMLGGITDPRSGQPLVDLEGAREVIEMFDTLREKTRGNLAKADEDLLLEVIGSLKLTFMEISQAAAEAMAKKAGAKK